MEFFENDNIQQKLRNKILNELLPTYCIDQKRNYAIEGFKMESLNLTNEDASHFFRAFEHSVVTDSGGGRYIMPKSKTFEMIFWEGSKLKSPRNITLWIEPIITIGAIGRLHLDLDWPKELLGMQSKDGAFDLVAYSSIESDDFYIAGEVKKTSKELHDLIHNLFNFDVATHYDYLKMDRKLVNSHKKWLSLKQSRAPYFWAIGPGDETNMFKVKYLQDGNIEFESTSLDEVRYSKVTSI